MVTSHFCFTTNSSSSVILSCNPFAFTNLATESSDAFSKELLRISISSFKDNVSFSLSTSLLSMSRTVHVNCLIVVSISFCFLINSIDTCSFSTANFFFVSSSVMAARSCSSSNLLSSSMWTDFSL